MQKINKGTALHLARCMAWEMALTASSCPTTPARRRPESECRHFVFFVFFFVSIMYVDDIISYSSLFVFQSCVHEYIRVDSV